MTSDYADFSCLAAAGFFAVAFLAGFFRRGIGISFWLEISKKFSSVSEEEIQPNGQTASASQRKAPAALG